MLNQSIQVIQNEVDEITFNKSKSDSLSFEFDQNSQWLEAVGATMESNDPNLISQIIVQFADYLANPAIFIKNYTMINLTLEKVISRLETDKKSLADFYQED